MTNEGEERRELYVVSCRKRPAAGAPEVARVEVLTVPKRAGTYLLFRGPLDPAIEERDLVPVAQTDTDIGEQAERPRAEATAWHDRQQSTEDHIARLLWARGPLVLYVHGFNTKPGDAFRAGVRLQQALDEHKVGATVVVFTWPSAGHLLDYFPDQKSAGRFGSYALVNLLLSLRRTAPEGTLHCVAHSMGAYVVTRALSTISVLRLQRLLPRAEPIVSQVAFMNPDIDYDILCSGYTGPTFDSPSYLEIADGYGATTLVHWLTIYCTTNDVALFASLFKNRSKRLGAYGPGLEGTHDRKTVMNKRIRDNVFVVNCDEWCVFDALPQHSHSHFLECPGIMTDLMQVLAGTPKGAFKSHGRTDAPRWDRLLFQAGAANPGLLRDMATFWGVLGNVAVNPVAVRLVLWKKKLQWVWKLAKGIVPVLLTGSTGMLAWITRHLFWRAAFAVSIAALLLYFVAWLRARSIQKREDSLAMPANVSVAPPLAPTPPSRPSLAPAPGSGPSEEASGSIAVLPQLRLELRKWTASKSNESVTCSVSPEVPDSSSRGWIVILKGSDPHNDRRVFSTAEDAAAWIQQKRGEFQREGWLIRGERS